MIRWLIKYEEALRIKKETLPSNHSSIAETIDNIASVYQNQNRFDEALIKYEEALRNNFSFLAHSGFTTT